MKAVFPPAPNGFAGAAPPVLAQPSKNYTTRTILAAALADGTSTIRNAATSEDAEALIRCLGRLGVRIDELPAPATPGRPAAGRDFHVAGTGGRLTSPGDDPLDVGNAGAVLRFLLAVCATLPSVTFITPFPESLGRRPHGPLLRALEDLGCRTESRDGGLLPITLHGGSLTATSVSIDGSKSSQYLSGLLFLAPLLGHSLEIAVTGGLVSKAPIRQTLETLERFGCTVTSSAALDHFAVAPARYQPQDFTVNGDWPGSAALFAAAAISRTPLAVRGLQDDAQGEKLCLHALHRMGASLDTGTWGPPGTDSVASFLGAGEVRLASGGPLRATEIDGDLLTDAVLALVAGACFARGRTRIHNAANLRLKECDRITEPLRELRKIGVACHEGHEAGDPDPDAILIDGNPDGYDGGVEVDGRGDHRVIMMLAAVALGCRKGLTITGAQHVAKSYPDFFNHLRALGARFELLPD